MSSFKDMILNDNDIFLNLDEFAEEHNLNGVCCKAVVQSPQSRKSFTVDGDYADFTGIYGTLIVVHCKAVDLEEVPAEGQRFDLDDRIYKVASCINDMGILTITLQGEMMVE